MEIKKVVDVVLSGMINLVMQSVLCKKWMDFVHQIPKALFL
jgi:hypothetical protein